MDSEADDIINMSDEELDRRFAKGVPVNSECAYCHEKVLAGHDQGRGYLFDVNGHLQAKHRECGLRMVLGGIGHLIDHAHFCPDNTDAGLTYRQSALLVQAWVDIFGIEATVAASHDGHAHL